MLLPKALQDSARACEGAAFALAHSLRPSATKESPAPNVLSTFQEAQAFCITCRAVMEEVAPVIPYLSPTASCVGNFLKAKSPDNFVSNGYDSLVVILIKLFDNANDAILDVAALHSRWIVAPLQTTVSLERMVTHHGQLRGFYGIMHLAAKILTHTTDVSKSLFLDLTERTQSEMQPAKWRDAIKLDDFYGRHFGFHYTPEMRNVLRVVNIARGSIHKSHNEDDATPQLVKNVVMLGWGWIYSNMVIMNNLGLSIDGASQIGADNHKEAMTIQRLRKFMNLVEEPLVTGVTGLASADVAIDHPFEIPVPGQKGAVEIASSTSDDALRDVLLSISQPVQVRLLSFKSRPSDLPVSSIKRNPLNPDVNSPASIKTQSPARVAKNIPKRGISEERNGRAITLGPSNHSRQEAHRGELSTAKNTIKGNCDEMPSTKPRSKPAGVGSPVEAAEGTVAHIASVSPPIGAKKVTVQDKAGPSDNAFLTTTIASELRRWKSNVSTLLGMEEEKPARGLIMHFHGGGFVSQSSEAHAVYTKEWCADVDDSVLLSVDYQLAPESQFPVAVYECLYAYIWALQNASRLGTLAERVVFVGDSAGGNLALSTALKAAQLGVRGADGICLAYPSLYVTTAWSPSRLLSFFDPLLPLSVLELCLKSYVPDGVDGANDALISPMIAAGEDLKRLAPITVICGSLDPLLDDAAVFAQRLHDLREGDVFKVYQSLPHGFLNMNQMNVTARSAMRFLGKTIANYLDVPLRRGSRAAGDDESEIRTRVAAAEATAAAAAFDK